jgi:hypothetical protein
MEASSKRVVNCSPKSHIPLIPSKDVTQAGSGCEGAIVAKPACAEGALKI